MKNNQNDNLMTFGEHLEVFRKMLFRIIGITVCLTVFIFCAKETTFNLLLAPCYLYETFFFKIMSLLSPDKTSI